MYFLACFNFHFVGEAIGVKGGNGRTGKGKELGARCEIY